ncbi:MAG: DUF998 domain-containing protein [Bacteroidetes bacterium]|nr:DUF998 domain-containing protein [Bacteroidota bacterium]
MENKKGNVDDIIVSYTALRKAIGILGIMFPVILIAGAYIMQFCEPIQSSISCYYHTVMRNVFEGVLWVFAVFLLFYRYEKTDNVATTAAGFCALGVALFPTLVRNCSTCDYLCSSSCMTENCREVIGRFHLTFASLFFLILSWISLFLFTKTDKTKKPTLMKIRRNRVYIVCGIIMLVCIVLIGIYFLCLKTKYPWLDKCNPVFWLEAAALWSFGISWIVKGDTILKDKTEPIVLSS